MQNIARYVTIIIKQKTKFSENIKLQTRTF